MIESIRKRSGDIVPFDPEKITWAIFKAAAAVGGDDWQRAEELSRQVVEMATSRTGVLDVEEVQDMVEKVLIENRHARTAKAVAEQERAELAHGQGPHFFRIAERNRLFGQILHKPVIDGIPPFIVDILEILHAPAVAALKPNDGKPGFGAFGKGDAPGEAHAHSNHIHLFQFFGHVVLLDYSMLDRDTGGTFSNVSLVMRYV